MNKPMVSRPVKTRKFLTILVVVLVLAAVTLSCSLPFKIVWTGGDSADQPAAEQAGGPDQVQPTETQSEEASVETVTEEPSTVTPSLTPSPSITSAPVQQTLYGTVSKNTNCRSGPQENYDLVHVLKKGDTVALLGKNEDGSWWFIRWQNGEVYECWMWNEYVSGGGAAESLLVLTPPPSPSPVLAFVLSYKNTTGETTVNVYLRNSGNIPLASYSATFKDTTTGESLTKTSDSFGSMAGVGVGNITTLSSPSFSASTTGHSMKVTVKACTGDGLTGKCSTVSTTFTSN